MPNLGKPCISAPGSLRSVHEKDPGPPSEEKAVEEAAEEYFGPRFLARLHARLHLNPVTGLVTKMVVTLVGVLVMVAGVVMMVTPGPGIVALVFGLAILSTEWRWADRLLDRARQYAHDAAEKARKMDPRVRRRRLLQGAGVVAAVVLALGAYLWVFDWPGWVVSWWDQAQRWMGWLPDLPGMS